VLPELFKPGFGGCGGMFEFATAIGVEALSTMEAPYLDRLVKTEKRRDFTGRAAGDDCHASFALPLNAAKRWPDSGVGARCEAIDPKGRECAVVVEQQNRAICGGKTGKELIEFFLRLRGHRLPAYVESLSFDRRAI
jgi:hypothetical protein